MQHGFDENVTVLDVNINYFLILNNCFFVTESPSAYTRRTSSR